MFARPSPGWTPGDAVVVALPDAAGHARRKQRRVHDRMETDDPRAAADVAGAERRPGVEDSGGAAAIGRRDHAIDREPHARLRLRSGQHAVDGGGEAPEAPRAPRWRRRRGPSCRPRCPAADAVRRRSAPLPRARRTALSSARLSGAATPRTRKVVPTITAVVHRRCLSRIRMQILPHRLQFCAIRAGRPGVRPWGQVTSRGQLPGPTDSIRTASGRIANTRLTCREGCLETAHRRFHRLRQSEGRFDRPTVGRVVRILRPGPSGSFRPSVSPRSSTES